TSGRVPYETTNGRLIDSANLAWDNTNGALNIGGQATTTSPTAYLKVSESVNAGAWQMIENRSNGSAAYAEARVQNDGGNAMSVYKTSSGYTTAGLIVANQGAFYNDNGTMLFANAAGSDMIWSVAGTATSNEAMRILGAAGTG